MLKFMRWSVFNKYVIYFSCLVASVLFVKKLNFYHGELDVYIPHYLSSGSIFSLIYSPIAELDFTHSTFRGREFGSLLNYIDVKILSTSLKIGIFSWVHYGLIVLMLFSVHVSEQKISKYRRDALDLLLLFNILLIVSSPIMLGGVFYRANKISAAVFITLSILIYFNKKTFVKNGLPVYLITIFCFISALSDEQGFAFLCVLTLYAFFDMLFNWGKRVDHIYAVGLAFMLVLIYRFIIGPIIYEVYNPSILKDEIFKFNYEFTFQKFVDALGLFSRYLSFLLGNIAERFLYMLFFVTLMYFYIRDFRFSIDSRLRQLFYALLIFSVGGFLMIFAMVQKHPAILWRDIVSYYSFPTIFIFYIFLYLITREAVDSGIFIKRRVHNLVAGLIFFNLISILPNYNIIASGHMSIFRRANAITDAYLADTHKKRDLILRSIGIDGARDGKRDDMEYGQAGVDALIELKSHD